MWEGFEEEEFGDVGQAKAAKDRSEKAKMSVYQEAQRSGCERPKG